MTSVCLDCFQNCRLPKGINDTTLVIILKKAKSTKLPDLRLISLCNIIYKIIAKVLVNRLKHVLPYVISVNQSAFIPRRLITDNIMIAHEVNHYLKRKRQGKHSFLALKMDMSKAYDCIEWKFLKGMFLKLGFHQSWVDKLILCVSIVRYHVLQNGEEISPIYPEQGLHKGDPLFPYLFILCTEGLSCMLNTMEKRGYIHGVQVARGSPIISHLFFTDDSYLFCRANEQGGQHIRLSLRLYEKASRQKVNIEKSSLTFSSNMSDRLRASLCSLFGAPVTSHHEKYLGLPVLIGRNKTDAFDYLRERIRGRIQGWSKRFLSRAGKEIMLKTVIQMILSYVMSVFRIPHSLCDVLEKIMNSY